MPPRSACHPLRAIPCTPAHAEQLVQLCKECSCCNVLPQLLQGTPCLAQTSCCSKHAVLHAHAHTVCSQPALSMHAYAYSPAYAHKCCSVNALCLAQCNRSHCSVHAALPACCIALHTLQQSMPCCTHCNAHTCPCCTARALPCTCTMRTTLHTLHCICPASCMHTQPCTHTHSICLAVPALHCTCMHTLHRTCAELHRLLASHIRHALLYTGHPLHCTALHCIALHCIALHARCTARTAAAPTAPRTLRTRRAAPQDGGRPRPRPSARRPPPQDGGRPPKMAAGRDSAPRRAAHLPKMAAALKAGRRGAGRVRAGGRR